MAIGARLCATAYRHVWTIVKHRTETGVEVLFPREGGLPWLPLRRRWGRWANRGHDAHRGFRQGNIPKLRVACPMLGPRPLARGGGGGSFGGAYSFHGHPPSAAGSGMMWHWVARSKL